MNERLNLFPSARKAALLMALRTLVSVHFNTKILGIGHCAKFVIKNIQQFFFNIKSTLNDYYDDDNYVTVCHPVM